ncbi:HAMP domain-containing sensor histidine kinase [Gorillibacterium sp. sgz5001074]|uniref:sensor histidine kinase n=1 Tax=Gorillibacterium sp. sgz5001074 TaxID=3446695 RepID=UPI003F663565
MTARKRRLPVRGSLLAAWARKLRLRNSLLSQYVLLVLSALILLPGALVVMTMSAYWMTLTLGKESTSPYRDDGRVLEREWHAEAAALAGATAEKVDERLRQLREVYPEASLFWVDRSGQTRLALPDRPDLPGTWNASYTVQFMKERVQGDPFTVVAFIGDDVSLQEGFMTIQVPLRLMDMNRPRSVPYLIGMGALSALFLGVSLLFFLRIRRRLVRLQEAMTLPAADRSSLPAPVPVLNGDEIGRLEAAFNEMVRQLQEGREREAGEEKLRRELIARLSHDLRTPLTAIRGHAYSLRRETLSAQALASVDLIERKTDALGQLLENLLSFSLLSAGKYPLSKRRTDVVRLVRTHFAGWYPVFEQEGFTMELDLPETAFHWEIDPLGLERMLDNYLQNVLRHAKPGGYIGLRVEPEGGGRITIEDRGPGMQGRSDERGAGIGLSIARLLAKEMGLATKIRSGQGGTVVGIFLNEN